MANRPIQTGAGCRRPAGGGRTNGHQTARAIHVPRHDTFGFRDLLGTIAEQKHVAGRNGRGVGLWNLGRQCVEQIGECLGQPPILGKSTAVLASFRERLAGKVVLIGAGGIASAGDARRKVDAGAALVQLYTGLIYRGPALVRECVSAFPEP